MHVAQSERRSETNALEQGIVSGEVSTEAVGSTYVIKRALQALHAAPCMCSCRRLITRRKPKYRMQLYSHVVPCSTESLDARSASASQRLIVWLRNSLARRLSTWPAARFDDLLYFLRPRAAPRILLERYR